jgi:hypothetical protein
VAIICGIATWLAGCHDRRQDDAVEAAAPRDGLAGPAQGDGKLRSTALAHIPVGVVIERRKAKSPWLDVLWRPVSVLAGHPSAAPWTPIGAEAETATFYAGEAVIELHRTETANYRSNLASGAPALWVVLRPTASEPAYEVLAVTADPAEGEAFAAGNDLVETVPMPASIAERIDRFVAEHHVERPFVKRRRRAEAHAPADWESGE